MKEELLRLLAEFGQEHLLQFWDQLDDPDQPEQDSLAAEIRAIDFELVRSLCEQRGQSQDVQSLAQDAEAPPSFRLGDPANRFSPEEARRRGEESLRAGQVAVNLVAGGRGSRLGFEHPKGMFPIGPLSESTLFQILLEKILAASRRYGARIPLYLMTSPATHAETVDFLTRHERFGLPEEDAIIYCQGTMPAVDAATGKVVLERPDHVSLSPDGHGGMLAALDRDGRLRDMRERGIRHLFHLQVDNPLVQIGLPEFIGYHSLSQSEMSTQVIAKRTPYDRVGNVVEIDERLHVIEYSDLPNEVAERRAPDGSLLLRLGSIAVHVFDVAFLKRTADQPDALLFHIARKKVKCLAPGSRSTRAKKRKVVQFERFIFDLMPWAENAVVVEVDAARHFAPLKNASGQEEDTPEMVQAQMVALHTEWLREAGAEVADGVPVEISPLFALDADQVAEKIRPGARVSEPTCFH